MLSKELLDFVRRLEQAIEELGGQFIPTTAEKPALVHQIALMAVSKPHLITLNTHGQLDRAIREVGGNDKDVEAIGSPRGREALARLSLHWAREVVPLGRQVFPVTIDGNLTIAQMVDAIDFPPKCWYMQGAYPDHEEFVEEFTMLAQAKYEPKFAGRIVQRRLRLMPFKKNRLSGQEAMVVIKNNKGHMSTYEDGLAFAAQFPEICRRASIRVLDPEGPIWDNERCGLEINSEGVRPHLFLLGLGYEVNKFQWGLALCDE